MDQRCCAYRKLLNQHLDKLQVPMIREAICQERVRVHEDCKDKIEVMLQAQVRPGISGWPNIDESNATFCL